MKKITAQHSYKISTTELFSYFSDETKRAQKYQQLGAQKYRLKRAEQQQNVLTIEARRQVPVGDEVPSSLRKFVNEYNRVRQRETWTINDNGQYQGELRVDIDGIPAKVQGTMVITPTALGCTNQIALHITSTLPIIGHLVVEFVAKNIEQQMESEYSYIKAEATKQTPVS